MDKSSSASVLPPDFSEPRKFSDMVLVLGGGGRGWGGGVYSRLLSEFRKQLCRGY